ncbi:hypothetical protein LAT59_04450 [Candidatus Gracilibacteria bacterium]|nr:hypothetical protein [Candidatus Gracilibacteria bacterium]
MNNFPKFGDGGGLFGTLPTKSSIQIGGLPETLKAKKSITLVTGFLGAGKTTLINELLPSLPKNTRFIINDMGVTNIDAERIQSDDTVQLEDSCICCGSLDELIRAIEDSSAEHILIEPTGIASPQSILGYLQEKGYEVSTITVVNTDSFEEYVSDEAMSATLISQIQVASIIALRGKSENQEYFSKWLEKYGLQEISQIPLPEVQHGMEILPGQEASDFYKNFWEQVEGLRTDTQSDVSDIMAGHFKGQSESFQGKQISDEGLQKYITYLTEQGIRVLRAKGTNADGEFDYAGGMYKERSGVGFSHFVIITDKSLSQQERDILDTFITKYPSMQKNTVEIPSFEESETYIQKLVEQYKEYMEMYTEKQGIEKSVQDESISEKEKAAFVRVLNTLNFKLQKLGDAMKFDNPFIWIGYKKAAYEGTENEIPTLGAFRDHCAIDNPDSRYICKKRFLFLNRILKERYGVDFSQDSDTLHAEISLGEILALPEIEALSRDETFMKEWLGYEYFERGGKTMKWENYHSLA